MSVEIFFVAVMILLAFAVFDLMVGVTNDAVNFLNSAIGSRVAPFIVIMIIASLGILAGVTFSSGMMEVARKGIFHPQFFTMPELFTIFMAVMLTDVLLLDFFNTHGLPTSTTVSIVFELLGAAVAAAVIKVMHSADGMTVGEYINTAKALTIISGILLSIVVAFFAGALVQWVTRFIFTFDYHARLKRYGALWGGVAMAAITFFILIKGAKGASFMSAETVDWIKTHSATLLFMIFVVSAIVLQAMISIFEMNIFKPIVLVGTFALAMAFASNDLVNFIGVPLAGLFTYRTAVASNDPLNVTMEALSQKVHSQTPLLIAAGVIMVLTLWLSRKARMVTDTEISLGQQEEGTERFESIWLSRAIVSMASSCIDSWKSLVPRRIQKLVARRMDPRKRHTPGIHSLHHAPFDLVRAAVNLMVASAVVSFATSMKLPLSTTYVTFMVAMGTSFSDQAWGRESAVYRVTGVLTVVGGWFMTALVAFVVSFVFAGVIHYFNVVGVLSLMALAGLMIWKNHLTHKVRAKEKEEIKIFNLKKVKDAQGAISNTFDHMAYLLHEIRESLGVTFEALFTEDVDTLGRQKKKIGQVQVWANIIMANIFKVLRLLQKEDAKISYKYAQTIRRLQKLSDGHRDIILRSYVHTSNRHKGLLAVQIEEIKKIEICILDILRKVETSFYEKRIVDYQYIVNQYQYMRELADQINEKQIVRIRNDSSKTRLSILYYALVGNCLMLAKQNVKLLEIFNESFTFDDTLTDSYFEVETN